MAASETTVWPFLFIDYRFSPEHDVLLDTRWVVNRGVARATSLGLFERESVRGSGISEAGSPEIEEARRASQSAVLAVAAKRSFPSLVPIYHALTPPVGKCVAFLSMGARHLCFSVQVFRYVK